MEGLSGYDGEKGDSGAPGPVGNPGPSGLPGAKGDDTQILVSNDQRFSVFRSFRIT